MHNASAGRASGYLPHGVHCVSDLTGYTDLNHADLVARIERQQAETRKFVAEGIKLTAEAGKLGRERWLAPVLALASVLLAGGSVILAYASLMRH